MAGIYIHYPFCKSRCYYCDFYSVTEEKLSEAFFQALLFELNLRKSMLGDAVIETIYFGGGTPSLLSAPKIGLIIEEIAKHFNIADHAEITIEANPDDVTSGYARRLHEEGVNRISLGIQSFYNYHLRLMNRRHKVLKGIKSIEIFKSAGFDNISIDLIYGLPEFTLAEWKKTLKKAVNLDIQHISAYHLTYEDNTVFSTLKKKGLLKPVDEELSYQQFMLLSEFLEANNFVHYEISNFGHLGRFSRHNINYWKNIPYLGLGPSAHSFDGKNRYWNDSNISKYIRIDKKIGDIITKEELSAKDFFNEYIMTGLRTYWGIDIDYIKEHFSEQQAISTERFATPYIDSEHIRKERNKLILTKKGMLISYKIIADLFMS
ncbi:MAG: radical SAM family heme chaperone HemW [Salinivirgaceae bacterium]|jgi:oxygen-independent coproporphyrinogen-3 oxidase|nr:radical SAM family heme chaperone HemW [Salinivirgaceae bacterium]